MASALNSTRKHCHDSNQIIDCKFNACIDHIVYVLNNINLKRIVLALH
jgi:hypothetical protein